MSRRIIQNKLKTIARRCANSQMQTGNGGNLSARYKQSMMIVKSSKCSFESCISDDFVLCDLNGNLIKGKKNPSRESFLHSALYSKFARIGAIVHCHSPYATAFAAAHQALKFSTYHSKIKLKESVLVFDTNSYTVSKEDTMTILNQYTEKSEFMGFLLRGHGLVAVGKDLDEAVCTAELIEETAKIYVLSQMLELSNHYKSNKAC